MDEILAFVNTYWKYIVLAIGYLVLLIISQTYLEAAQLLIYKQAMQPKLTIKYYL